VASVVVGVLGLAVARRLRSRAPRHPWIDVLTALAMGSFVILTFVPMSYESHRMATRVFADPTAHRATLSVWWAVYGTLAVAFGFVRGYKPARLAGLALLGVVAAKVLVIDLMGVSLLWRAVSFLAVGVLMLGVAVAYGWIARKLEEVRRAVVV
jgi:uncharacterized membrane protein